MTQKIGTKKLGLCTESISVNVFKHFELVCNKILELIQAAG